jgi:hypothetical protein
MKRTRHLLNHVLILPSTTFASLWLRARRLNDHCASFFPANHYFSRTHRPTNHNKGPVGSTVVPYAVRNESRALDGNPAAPKIDSFGKVLHSHAVLRWD